MQRPIAFLKTIKIVPSLSDLVFCLQKIKAPLFSDCCFKTYFKVNKIKVLGVNNFEPHRLSASHHKTVAQVILRWDIQQDILLVVKSVKPKRRASNAAVFDFKLSPEDMQRIDALNADLRVGPNPDEFDF
ncbi:aldo/keto reductase [Levilactobacillus brevis]|nr:aldo/keto reductase [Lactobacillus sp. GPR40-2]MBL3630781.1 aldo/keto reductase [Lactobacillus sp. GPB7-4]MBU5273620.1 aldo/keto reductase [Levilactobacillus brevis]MBU7538926.1 aldo/keto reductase [Levilactobacillus brevis]MBU7559948.1 aldo/keto reductase [Levilactobacillus brevis]